MVPVAWLSSNPDIATVDSSGDVQALSAGTSTISANVNGKSGSIVVTVANVVPVVTSISPTSLMAGSAAISVAVVGSGFTSTSVVRWNGAAVPTTFTSATSLTAQVPASDLTAAGTFPITVFTGAPGGGASAPQTLTVLAAPPVLTYSQLPDSLVMRIDTSLIEQIGSVAPSITSPGLVTPGATAGFERTAGSIARTRSVLFGQRQVPGFPAAQLRDGDCPVISPAEPSVNAAGLPQSPVTYTFEDANCDDASIGQNGVVVLSDPTPTSSALNYDIVVTDFHFRLTDSAYSDTDIINAVDSVRNSTAGRVDEWVTETQDFTLSGSQTGHVVETLVLHTVYTYAASAGQLVYNTPMFPGSIVVDESITYVIDPGGTLGVSGTIPIQTTTLVPLQFDPTCQSDTPFSAGVLQNVEAGHTSTITYHGCTVPPTTP